MGALKEIPLMTEEQYLALERNADMRHEYLDGLIYAMAGEKRPHGLVSTNLIAGIHFQLKGTACEAFSKDTKVRSGPLPAFNQSTNGLYSYPDIVVICGGTEYLDEYQDVVVNPTIIIDILSPSTESFDRGAKFDKYAEWNLTLKEYLLVWQTETQIEQYERQADGVWSLRRHKGLNATLTIPSIHCTLSLRDIYDRVDFPDAAAIDQIYRSSRGE